ncbi:MAG TPA: carboxypeptidase-like regulatory domain-containing protein [Solirubrobacterales bacterium]|nr:carboxypeptidase-like regulatory domain-containing protein [Solirubrobacterales bacterium]
MTGQGTSIRIGWAALAASAALLALAAIAPASALAGSIGGTVTDASTHEPVAGLEVCAYPLENEEEEIFEEWFCEKTNASGEYTIADLDEGEYGVEFWGRPLNYVPQYFDGHGEWWEWDPVVVGAGAVTGIDAEMVEGGGVEGSVDRASGGTPVVDASVCAWTMESEEFGGCAKTNSSGEYALKGMPAGEYEVSFWAEEQDLQRQYYDHKAHWWEADPVSVSLGAVSIGIDADLLPAAKVEGQVRRASNGAPLTEVEVCIWSTDPEGAGRCTTPGNDGRYSIGGLPGDSYKVEFWPYEEDLPIQYWNHKPSWEEADVLSLSNGTVANGIDADLGSPPPTVTVIPPPPPVAKKPQPRRKHCKKGFRKKRVHGKVRCVKRKKRKHARQVRSRPGAPSRAAFRPGR